MEIALEKLIRLVTAEVVKELKKQGIRVVDSSLGTSSNAATDEFRTKTETLDMSKYVTPIVTEGQIRKLHELTGEICIPKGTVITPKARELINEKKLLIRFLN